MYPDFDWWKITVDDRCLYISEGRVTGNPAPASFQLRALSIATGKIVWERSLVGRLLDRPCLADDLLLTPMGDGTVLAINRGNGGIVWRKRVANSDPGVTQAGMVLQAADGIAVAQVGAGRLVALRVNDGAQLWAYPSGVPVEGGSSESVTLKDGMVYAFLACNKLVAMEATSGRQRWARETRGSGSPCPAVVPSGDLLVTQPFGGAAVAVDRSDGHTVWLSAARRQESSLHPPISLSWRHDATANENSGHALFAVMSSLPRLNGVPKAAGATTKLAPRPSFSFARTTPGSKAGDEWDVIWERKDPTSGIIYPDQQLSVFLQGETGAIEMFGLYCPSPSPRSVAFKVSRTQATATAQSLLQSVGVETPSPVSVQQRIVQPNTY